MPLKEAQEGRAECIARPGSMTRGDLKNYPTSTPSPLVLIAIALIAIAVTMNARLDDGGQGQW